MCSFCYIYKVVILACKHLEPEGEQEERILFSFLWLSFNLPCSIHVFPVAFSPSLLMSYSLLLPLLLSANLIPQGTVVLFFCTSSRHKAKESPRQPSVYQAFCHVDKDRQLLSLTSTNPNFQHCFPSIFCYSKAGTHLYNHCPSPSMSVCMSEYMCVSPPTGSPKAPSSHPGIIDLTNCRPCFILRKWQEQSGETEPGD